MPSRPPLTTLAALGGTALLGGAAALAGAVALGVADGGTTTTVVRETGSAAPAAAVTSSALPVREIYRRSAPGVVQITASSAPTVQTDPVRRPVRVAGTAGARLRLRDRQGRPHRHELPRRRGASEIEIGFSNHDTRKATIVGTDPSTDLAVLKVDASARALTPLPLADSDGVQVGDQVVAIGNPFGLERTATLGIVSALQRAVTAPNGYTIDHVIQTDAPINRGNSGGPLIDVHGRVIGVNSQIETGGEGATGNVGIGFAVPSNTVQHGRRADPRQGPRRPLLRRRLRDDGDARARPRLPSAGRQRPPAGAGRARQPGGEGRPQGRHDGRRGRRRGLPARRRPRRRGRRPPRHHASPSCATCSHAHRPGDEIELELYRGDEKQTVRVKLGRQPARPALAPDRRGSIPLGPRPRAAEPTAAVGCRARGREWARPARLPPGRREALFGPGVRAQRLVGERGSRARSERQLRLSRGQVSPARNVGSRACSPGSPSTISPRQPPVVAEREARGREALLHRLSRSAPPPRRRVAGCELRGFPAQRLELGDRRVTLGGEPLLQRRVARDRHAHQPDDHLRQVRRLAALGSRLRLARARRSAPSPAARRGTARVAGAGERGRPSSAPGSARCSGSRRSRSTVGLS